MAWGLLLACALAVGVSCGSERHRGEGGSPASSMEETEQPAQTASRLAWDDFRNSADQKLENLEDKLDAMRDGAQAMERDQIDRWSEHAAKVRDELAQEAAEASAQSEQKRAALKDEVGTVERDASDLLARLQGQPPASEDQSSQSGDESDD